MATDASTFTDGPAESVPDSGPPAPGGAAQVGAAALTARQTTVLVVAVFAAGLCSIIYELLIGTASSYFLGNSIQQFSITIGLFMASMGLGSFLSRLLGERVLGAFVKVELALGLVGGVSIPALYAIYAYTDLYYPAMVLFIAMIGTLTGLEIPMLVLAMRRFFALQVSLSNILSLDYLGALVATLLFPFALLPLLGTFKSSLVAGALNVAVALVVLKAFSGHIDSRQRIGFSLFGVGALVGLSLLLVFSSALLRPWHHAIYDDQVLLVRQSPYQKIVVTRHRSDLRLYLNGNLQFSSLDEYRYHEALIHPAFSLSQNHKQVLVLGGGDGIATREILKYKDVGSVTVIDLDPAMTNLARDNHLLRSINHDSFRSPRVHVENKDAWVFAKKSRRLFNVIVIDLPDPNDTSLARLYSLEFYGLLARHLAHDGVLVTQATSPFFAKKAFWCIADTLHAAGLTVAPYHADVPSFGDWGFVLAAGFPIDPSKIRVGVPTRYLDTAMIPRLFEFPRDVRIASRKVSTLDDPIVLSRYLEGWKDWQ